MGQVVEILDEYNGDPITIRHLFYRLVSRQVIEKDEKAYNLLCSHLKKWRIAGELPFNRFVDGTRWHYGEAGSDDIATALDDSIAGYRKNLWMTQEWYVEIWCEKEAIAALVLPVARQWALRMFICRGFASLSSTFSAAEEFKRAMRAGRIPAILYLGDYDPSGLAIDASIEKHFSYYGIGGQVFFNRVALQVSHIVELELPTRPVKKTDTRSRGWDGGCVEIDTLSGEQIRQLLNARIEELVDGAEWRRLKSIEQAERETAIRVMHSLRHELEEAP